MKIDFGNTFTYDGETYVIGSDEWKDWVMGSDPFEGDFGCDESLSDKIVKARNTKVLCSGCLSICKPKTYNRVITSKDGGVLLQNRFCQLCCTAMGFYEIHAGRVEYDEDNKQTIILDEQLSQYDEDQLEDDDLGEAYNLQDHLYALRDYNETLLRYALGDRWFDEQNELKYSVIKNVESVCL